MPTAKPRDAVWVLAGTYDAAGAAAGAEGPGAAEKSAKRSGGGPAGRATLAAAEGPGAQAQGGVRPGARKAGRESGRRSESDGDRRRRGGGASRKEGRDGLHDARADDAEARQRIMDAFEAETVCQRVIMMN